MHELSIAQSLVEQIEDELLSRNAADLRGDETGVCGKIKRVVVTVGALSGVYPDALAAAFPAAAANSPARGATLVINFCPVVIWCENCNAEQTLPLAGRLRCPSCGALSGKVLSGRQLELTSIEVLHVHSSDVHSGANPAPDPGSPDANPQEK